MDVPLVKAGPISSAGGASGIMHLRRGKVIAQEQIAAREESNNM